MNETDTMKETQPMTAVSTIPSVEDAQGITMHAINNRLNTLMIGMSYLEDSTDADQQTVVRSLKLELRDLQNLIEQLRYQGC